MSLETTAIKFIKVVKDAFFGMTIYAGNSGGKDSAVLDSLLQKSGIKYRNAAFSPDREKI